MNIISPPPPESFAPARVPLLLAVVHTSLAKSFVKDWRKYRDAKFLDKARSSATEANYWSLEASRRSGGAR